MAVRRTFSVRAFLLGIIAVSVLMGIYSLQRHLRLANEELHRLREETGRLSIGDRSQVHAIAVATAEPDTWRWRLFIPKGHRYAWHLACDEIPRDSVPAEAGTTGISNEPYWEQDNEVLVTATLRRTTDEERVFAVDSRIGDAQSQMYGASLKIPADKLRWMSEITSTDGQMIGDRATATCDPHGPIILFQRRPCVREPDGTYAPSAVPMPGLMIWLEEL
jgi:hypothetical protein